MTENKRFTLTEQFNGLQGVTFVKDNCEDDVDTYYTVDGAVDLLNQLSEENEQLKKELKEFKDHVFSDEEILCYSCVNCISKGIYEVECSEKGKVDVHGSCFSYWKKELQE